MKLDKLLKRLKKDAAASPQKAGALALMVVVALYFWAPLVLKYTKGKSKPVAVAASQVILTDDPIIARAAPHPATNVAHWDRVRNSIAADQYMVAAQLDPRWQQPFTRGHGLKAEKQIAKATEPAEVTERQRLPGTTIAGSATVELDTAKAALSAVTLSSVLIGRRDRSAMIRGNVYRVGDSLALGGDAGAPAIELLVCGIDASGVDLDYAGQRLRLERAKPKLSPGDHLGQH